MTSEARSLSSLFRAGTVSHHPEEQFEGSPRLTLSPHEGKNDSVSVNERDRLRKLVDRGERFVLDASVIVAHLADESGADVLSIVREKASIPFVAITELCYIIWRKNGKADADRACGLVRSWEVPILYPTAVTLMIAGRFKAIHAMGLGDAYTAALAYEHHATLLTKDLDYKRLSGEIKLFLLE